MLRLTQREQTVLITVLLLLFLGLAVKLYRTASLPDAVPAETKK